MSNVIQYRDIKLFIIKLQMNICKINSFNHRTIESIINSQHFLSFFIHLSKVICHILKKWRDWGTPARLPRSNEPTGRVTKGQAAQLVYAGLANEVVPK